MYIIKTIILFLILNINIAQSMSSCSDPTISTNLVEFCSEYNNSECLHDKSTQSECSPHLYDSIEEGRYLNDDIRNSYTLEDYYHINMPDLSSH